MKIRKLSTVALAVGFIFTTVGGAATSGTPSSMMKGEAEAYEVGEDPNIDWTNFKLVQGLDDLGTCLFTREVFPEGSVGPDGSENPYDVIADLGDRAFNTLRAELLRANTDSLAEVYSSKGESARGTTVTLLASEASGLNEKSLGSLVTRSPKAQDAYKLLVDLGVSFAVEARAPGALVDYCKVETSVNDSATLPLTPGSSYYRHFDVVSSTVNFFVQDWDTKLGEHLRSTFGDLVSVEYGEKGGKFELASRSDGTPKAGGAYYQSSGGRCSTGFKMTSYMLTAAHCNWASGATATSVTGGTYMGQTSSSLYQSANVDAQVLTGASYSGRMFTGKGYDYGNSTTTIAANGVYPTNTLTQGNQLIISGARTGQTSAGYHSSSGCVFLWQSIAENYRACQIVDYYAPSPFVQRGDSGGPVAAYDPANGRVIAAGIISGFYRALPENSARVYATSVMSVTYLYGNQPIG